MEEYTEQYIAQLEREMNPSQVLIASQIRPQWGNPFKNEKDFLLMLDYLCEAVGGKQAALLLVPEEVFKFFWDNPELEEWHYDMVKAPIKDGSIYATCPEFPGNPALRAVLKFDR